jgi:hypothetical protein
MRATIVAATTLMLCGCAAHNGPTPAEIEANQLAQIEDAKRDCTGRFPITPGRNHVAWARCYVDFYNQQILPGVRYPDLAKVVTAKRIALAEKVDQGTMTEAEADAELAQTRAWAVGEDQRRDNGAMQTQAQMAAARAAQVSAINSSSPTAVVVQPRCTVLIGGRCQ